jgi:hypothetical protein
MSAGGVHRPAGSPLGANRRAVKNDNFRVRGAIRTDARDHSRYSICVAPLEMPLVPTQRKWRLRSSVVQASAAPSREMKGAGLAVAAVAHQRASLGALLLRDSCSRTHGGAARWLSDNATLATSDRRPAASGAAPRASFLAVIGCCWLRVFGRILACGPRPRPGKARPADPPVETSNEDLGRGGGVAADNSR